MRKTLIAGVAALGILGGVAACTTGSTGQTTISLAQAQAEATAIEAALQAGASIYTSASTTTSAEATAAENVMKIATTAVGAFTGNASTETPAQLAETVSQDLEAVLAVLPIDPATKTAIDAGLAIIDGFVAGTFTQPAAPVASVALHAPEKVAPPVPIPAPHRLP